MLGDLLPMPVQRGAPRVSSSGALTASRYAVSGTLASTTRDRSAGSRTIMSGRMRTPLDFARFLFQKIAVLHHAGQLCDAAQRDFAPAAAGLRRTQRRGKRGGLARQRLQLLAEAAVRPFPARVPVRGRAPPSAAEGLGQRRTMPPQRLRSRSASAPGRPSFAARVVSSVARAASRNAL